jgi:hypothetical protein
MSTFAAGIKPFPPVRPKYLLFAILGFMLVYVVVHDESFLVHPKDPMWQHYQPFRWWLLPHGIAGACALLRSAEASTSTESASRGETADRASR